MLQPEIGYFTWPSRRGVLYPEKGKSYWPNRTVSWNSEPGKVYLLSRRASLATGAWERVGIVTAANTSVTLTDVHAATNRAIYYRISQSVE